MPTPGSSGQRPDFPHDTKVFATIGKDGGFKKFQADHLDTRTFAVAIRHRGYATAMMGKYLNGYGKPTMTPSTAPVAPGWSDWHVVSNGYLELNYYMNINGKVAFYGGPTGRCGVAGRPNNYGVDVLGSASRAFIKDRKGKRFALEIATFAPHSPYIPAPRNACDLPGSPSRATRHSTVPRRTRPRGWLSISRAR